MYRKLYALPRVITAGEPDLVPALLFRIFQKTALCVLILVTAVLFPLLAVRRRGRSLVRRSHLLHVGVARDVRRGIAPFVGGRCRFVGWLFVLVRRRGGWSWDAKKEFGRTEELVVCDALFDGSTEERLRRRTEDRLFGRRNAYLGGHEETIWEDGRTGYQW